MICISEEELKIVLDIIKRLYPKCRLLAFGSRYKWTNKDYSDLDLAIEGEEKISFEEMSKIKDAFEESDLNFSVDIIDLKGISEEFKEIVMNGNEEIYNGMNKLKDGWKRFKLGEVTSIGSSKRIFMSDYIKKGIPFYRSKEIIELSKGNKVTTELFINYEKYKEIKKKNGSPKIGDILLTSVGTIGIPYFVVEENFYFKDGNLTWIKEYKENIFNKYLYYWIKSPFGKNKIETTAIGSTQKALTIDSLKKIELLLPPLQQQKEIAYILSSLDDKIELNNKMNKTLEEMAQTLFKQWFVDFEFSNENGEPYKSSGGKMVESELGLIPEGWEVETLGSKKEFGELVMGLSPKSESYNEIKEGFPLLNGAADFDNLRLNPKKYTTSPTRIAKKNDFVFCVRATIGLLTIADKDYIIGRGVATIKNIQVEYKEYLYMVLNNSFQKLKMRATGSVIQGLSKPDINNLKLLFPNKDIIKYFHEIISKKMLNIENNKKEIIYLVQLRDILLYKLMNGDISIKNKI